MHNNTLKPIQTNTTFPNAPLAFFFGAFVTGPLFYLFISILIDIPTLLLLANLQATIPFFILLAAVKSPITMGVCGMLGGLGMLRIHYRELSIHKPSPESQQLMVDTSTNNDQTQACNLIAPTQKETPENTPTSDFKKQGPAETAEAISHSITCLSTRNPKRPATTQAFFLHPGIQPSPTALTSMHSSFTLSLTSS